MDLRSPTEVLQLAAQKHASGCVAEAEELCYRLLGQSSHNLDALNLLSAWARTSGRLDAAIEWATRAATAHPQVAECHANLGGLLHQAGKFDQSISEFQRAIGLDPSNPAFRFGLGLAFAESRQYESAAAELRRAVEIEPHAAAYSTLSAMLRQLGRFDDAISAARSALALDPQAATALVNLGVAFAEQGMYADAMTAYSKAIEIDPNFKHAHNNLAQVLLLLGDMDRGWKEAEWRSDVALYTAPKRWTGAAIDGKTILLIAEGGFGDAIQFARYVPMVAERGGRIILACDEKLVRLMSTLAGVGQIIPLGVHPPPFDLYCPAMSLPRAFGSTLQSVPANVPYLKAQDLKLGPKAAGSKAALRVGVVWAGNPGHSCDFKRSMRFELLKPLASVPGVEFYNLQMGDAAKQAGASADGPKLIDLTAELRDFADTASLIDSLDLVISVDTAIAHLAGAMGKPVWVMLPSSPEWRWMLNRDDSPWYPTMRLFRQKPIGDWNSVITSVAQALTELRERRGSGFPDNRG